MEKIYFKTSAIYFIAQRVIWKLQGKSNIANFILVILSLQPICLQNQASWVVLISYFDQLDSSLAS